MNGKSTRLQAVEQRIRNLRLERGWSLDELAAAANIAPEEARAAEQDIGDMRLDSFFYLARALGCDMHELVKPQD